MGLHAQNHRLTWVYMGLHGFVHTVLTFVSYGILHMKRKYTNLKYSVVALVVSQLFPILEVQGSNLACTHCMQSNIFLGLSFTFITCAYIYDSHLVPIVTITPYTLHLLVFFSIPYNFHAIAENLHDNVQWLLIRKSLLVGVWKRGILSSPN